MLLRTNMLSRYLARHLMIKMSGVEICRMKWTLPHPPLVVCGTRGGDVTTGVNDNFKDFSSWGTYDQRF